MQNTVSKKDEIEKFIELNNLNQISNEDEEKEDLSEKMTEDDKFHFFVGMN